MKSYLQKLRTINNDIDFSMLSSNKIIIKKEQVCLRDCIEEAISIVGTNFLHYKISKEVPEYIVSDKQRLLQVLVGVYYICIDSNNYKDITTEIGTTKESIKFDVNIKNIKEKEKEIEICKKICTLLQGNFYINDNHIEFFIHKNEK